MCCGSLLETVTEKHSSKLAPLRVNDVYLRELERRIDYEDSQKHYESDYIRDIAFNRAGERFFKGTLARDRCVLSQNGCHRSVPYSRSKCRDCDGTQRRAPIDFSRCPSHGPRAAWLRNCRQRQERFRLPRGAIMDVSV